MSEWWSLGLIGFPLGHSLSPIIHQSALKSVKLEGEYRLYPIPPGDAFTISFHDLCKKLSCGEINGLNVTIPHKQSVTPFMNTLSPTAKGIQAVNTIYYEDGRLIGDNTDVDGFLTDLNEQMETYGLGHVKSDLSLNRFAMVLGAGGSARAVIYGLIREGWNVTIVARRKDQAQKLIDELSAYSPFIHRRNIGILSMNGSEMTKWKFDRSQEFCILINTTPIGMWPNDQDTPWPIETPMPEFTFVYDLVYNPSETMLIQKAREINIPSVTGLGMLIEQARLSFEKWTGTKVPKHELWDAVHPQKGS